MSAAGDLRWRFSQCFGEKDADEEFSEADVLSAVKFDETGDYLATGDKGGRIVIFKRADAGKRRKRPFSAMGGGASGGASGGAGGAGGAGEADSDMYDRDTGAAVSAGGTPSKSEYRFYCEFQSHEAEFDYLKSLEIEEKINRIAWAKPMANSALFLLSTNDKTIKLWKIQEKAAKIVSSMNVEVGRYGGRMPVTSLRVPRCSVAETSVVATPRRVYANAHAYHINSISTNSDAHTFLSADDLRINLWSFENPTLSFNIVDIKPPTLEELTEVITAAKFHPTSCNVFSYSSSRGAVKVGDMRASALCDTGAKVFEEQEDAGSKSYFSEIIASVSDIEFTRDGRYVLARDYLSVKVWDLAMESRPVRVIPVHEFLRPKLPELYESDCIFDKFEVAASPSGNQLLTGSYAGCFKIYDVPQDTETSIELSKLRPRAPVTRRIPVLPAADGSTPAAAADAGPPQPDPDSLDYAKKVLHYSWHPEDNVVAIAGVNNLYLFSAE